MLDKFQSILQDECRLDARQPILVGVSGGPDSLCLLSLLRETGWQIIAAHFNHQLRPEAADEATSIEGLAQRMQAPFVGGLGDVRGHASEHKLSIETAARELRYRFLFEQARRYAAQAVAVGHTADDQVETVLMHFIRGAGLNGLRGMQYRSFLHAYDDTIPLIRPLLDTWRADTVAYCEERGLHPHYDASNESTDFLRNRLRHELIPLLESYNPRFREAAWRSGRTLSTDHELLSAALEPVWRKAVLRQAGSYVELDSVYVTSQPRGVQMHLLQRAVHHLLPECEVGFDALQRAALFIADASQDRMDFIGGLFLLLEEGRLSVARDENDLPRDQWPQMPATVDCMRFTIPFEITLASGWKFSASESSVSDLPDTWENASPREAWIDVGQSPPELELRVRRDGDRFQPLGIHEHSQKVSDFFVNEKLPARARARWPLICAGDEVLWVPGYRPADRVRVRPESRKLLHFVVSPPLIPVA